MENLSLNISLSSPKDDEKENEEVELNLGLSLGGQFGVDTTANKLTRSSSVATYLPVVRDDSTDTGGSQAAPPPVIVRTSSLPMESEEEWEKKRGMQSLRRMEAKRRRCEKQRNLNSEKEAGGGGGSLEDKMEVEVGPRGRLERENSLPVGMRPPPGGFNLKSKAARGSSGELSTGSLQSIPEECNQETGSSAVRPVQPDPEGPSRTPKNRGGPEIGLSALDDMPSVFTCPKGRRVDGILYKYGKGEEVKIMCVCHGTFHSPGEFVKHAGGPDVDNPLKHIGVKR
ncbi:hypothetical protein CASFOL_024222 [Castilleja foliolosa]|uniref:Ninja-family protein n=1 Tax=Castilleja foliolosa TaxID=1961234 RepID=A0ABD3CMN6_9LAMI